MNTVLIYVMNIMNIMSNQDLVIIKVKHMFTSALEEKNYYYYLMLNPMFPIQNKNHLYVNRSII